MCSIQDRRVRGLVASFFFEIEEFEIRARVFDSTPKGSSFGKAEGFEVWSPGLFLMLKGSKFGRVFFFKSKGSRFGRVCSIQDRRVRSLVACAFFKDEGFDLWARVFDSTSKSSRFGRLVKLKGSRFGRACSIQGRRVRG